jgi:predicted glycosyltransferase
MAASHDSGESGLGWPLGRELLNRLAKHGKVFISSESDLPEDLQAQRFDPPPHMLHDALYYASLLLGDSQTMAAEAAVLGTPCLHVSSFSRRLAYLDQLESSYGLIESFRPDDSKRIVSRLEHLLDNPEPERHARLHARMLTEKCDVAKWFTDYVLEPDYGA